MALTISNEDKNNLSISNESKNSDMTWDGSDPLTWDDDPGKWDAPKRPLVNEDKNSLSIINEDKN